jgi:hypothetical protein
MLETSGRPIHYGFATPHGCPIVLLLLGWYFLGFPKALGLYALVGLIVGGLGRLANLRFRRKVHGWAREQGYASIEMLPRGGFPNWAWTFWTFAETQPFCASDDVGNDWRILASYEAPLFGLIVHTCCERREQLASRAPSLGY